MIKPRIGCLTNVLRNEEIEMRVRYVESNIPDGIQVHVRYTTRYRSPENSRHLPKWYTQCQLISRETGEVVGYASSNCNEEDQPVRKIGRAVAVGRAFKVYWEDQHSALQSV